MGLGRIKQLDRLLISGLIATWLAAFLAPGSLASDVNRDHETGKVWELELAKADNAFDNARIAYVKGDTGKGDEELDSMMTALNSCIKSLDSVHKARLYKKAELRVAYLQRRMKALLDDIEIQSRGWAEQTDRKLEEVHERLIVGVMQK